MDLQDVHPPRMEGEAMLSGLSKVGFEDKRIIQTGVERRRDGMPMQQDVLRFRRGCRQIVMQGCEQAGKSRQQRGLLERAQDRKARYGEEHGVQTGE